MALGIATDGAQISLLASVRNNPVPREALISGKAEKRGNYLLRVTGSGLNCGKLPAVPQYLYHHMRAAVL